MNYDWLENVPSSNTPIPVYQPDFGFLQSMQMRANMQYEQGLSQVKNTYSSIFNQPVIGTSAKKVQQDYARQAQDQMKDISASDLSDPKNVATADKIMSPFYQDENLLTNIGLAKYYDNQDSKLDSWQNSTDKDVRAQYSDENRMAMQYKRQEIAAAPFSATAYNKIEKIGAVPFFDINNDIDKAYTDEKNKGVDNVSIIGGGVYTEHNGVKSLDSFRNYYLSKMGNKYDPQLRVHAYVNMYRQRQDILSKNPGLDPNQVDQQLALENVQQLNDDYVKNIKSYNDIGTYWEGRAKAILDETKNGKTADQDQQSKIQFYMEQAKAHREVAGKYQSQYKEIGSGDQNSPEYQKFFRELYEHPEQYIASIDKQKMAESWANGMAYMNTGLKVELDPVREAYLTHREKAVDQQIKQNEVNATLRGQNLSFEKETGIDPRTGKRNPNYRPDYGGWSRDLTGEEGNNGVPKGGINADGTINYAAWTAQGYNTTDVAHLAPDALKQQQEIVAGQINKTVLDPQAGLITSLKVSGALSQNELIDLNGWAASMDKGAKPTDIQNAVFQKAVSEMKNKGVDVSKIQTSHDLQTALINYTTTYANDLKTTTVGDNLATKHMIGTQLAVTAGKMQQQMQLYNQNQDVYNQKQAEILKGNSYYDTIKVLDPKTGQYHVINSDDIAPSMPNQVVLRPVGGHQTVTIDGKQLASILMDDNIDLGTGKGDLSDHKSGDHWMSPTVKYNGQEYYVEQVGNKPFKPPVEKNLWGTQWLMGEYNKHEHDNVTDIYSSKAKQELINNYLKPVFNKYALPKEMFKLRQEASGEVYSHLDFTKNGLITPRFGLDPSDANTAELATRSSKEMSSHSVVPVIMNEDGTTPASSEDQSKLRTVLMNKKSTESLVSNIYRTNTPDGSPAYGVVINQKGTDASTNEPADFSQKTYILPVSSLDNAPILANMPMKSNYLYQDLYNTNKTITADPIIKNYGQDFVVRGVDPGADGKATSVFVMLYYSHPEKGKVVQQPEVAYKIPLSGQNGKSPDEVMNFVHNRITEQLYKSDAILKNVQNENSREAAQYQASPNDVQQYSTAH